MENGFFLSEYLSARYLEKGERVSAKHEKEFKKANREKVTDYLIALGLRSFLMILRNQRLRVKVMGIGSLKKKE